MIWPFRRRRVEEIHVCSVPGVELRMTLDGKTIVQGDMKHLHYASIYGANTGEGWYDLLNNELIQFRPPHGSKISLEIRAIQTHDY